MTASTPAASESAASVVLPTGELTYTLRRSPRARSVRVVIHPERGVVVTVPTGRVSPAEGERRAAAFLAERESWVRRHLARQAEQAAVIEARGGGQDGGRIPFRGELHTVRVVPAVRGVRRSDVAWFGDTRDLVVHRVDRDARPDQVILAGWLREDRLSRRAILIFRKLDDAILKSLVDELPAVRARIWKATTLRLYMSEGIVK